MLSMQGHGVKRVRGGQPARSHCDAPAREDGCRRLSSVAAIVAALVAREPAASAQTLAPVDASTWRPSIDPRASLATEPVTTPGPGQWNLGASLQYAQDPVVIQGGTGPLRLIEHQLAGALIAGIGLGDRVAVGLDVPFFLWQDGEPTRAPSALEPSSPAPTTGLGDVALAGKVTLISNDRKGVNVGFGLAGTSSVSLPTGNTASYMGDDDVTASVEALGEYALGAAAGRVSLGYFDRTAAKSWGTYPPAAGNDRRIIFGDSVTWAAGFMLRPKALAPSLDGGDRQTWELAAHGAIPAGPVSPFGLGGGLASAVSPVLLTLDDRIGLGHYRDAFVLLGAEIGLSDAIGVPAFRGVVSFGWAPRNHDRDGDGVLDDTDQCPDLPEDRDGVQDEDGCPEDDADGDGILDDRDACPLAPGVASSDASRNGCPRPMTGPAATGASTREGGLHR